MPSSMPSSMPSPSRSSTEPATTQVLLVGDRDGPADRHPALQSWLDRNWTVTRAVRRQIAGVGTKLFVVLTR